MRVSGLVMCGLLLTACVGPPVEGAPSTGALTAAAALGDLRTVDYCTLLDTTNAEADSTVPSFEQCVVDVEDLRLVVGPVEEGKDLTLTPYDYREDLPSGVRVDQRYRSGEAACTLLVTFADGVRLTVSAAGEPEAEEGTHAGASVDWCATADRAVAGVLDTITSKRVGHATYDRDSFGSLDPCALITGPDFDAIAGAEAKVMRTLSGHECLNGAFLLSLTVAEPVEGPKETLGGRQAVVQAQQGPDSSYCAVYVERPLKDRSDLVEIAQLTVLGVGTTGQFEDADLCPVVRTAAALVVPKLPT